MLPSSATSSLSSVEEQKNGQDAPFHPPEAAPPLYLCSTAIASCFRTLDDH
ncbi:unnamed protein product, partial [Amoebophrya sp. A120]|eukprot:GSA120T00023952001.1